MDLDELRAFVAVIDNGSFKSAATALGQPRGTLRRRVDALESRAGITLLERGRSGVSLTHAGLKFARHGRQMLREAGSLLRTLRTLETRTSRIRIGLPIGFPPEGLHRFSEFMQKTVPEMRIELHFSEDPFQGLSHNLDCALSFRPSPSNKQILSRPLVDFRSGLVASKAYLARHGTPTSVAELREHRLISWIDNPSEPNAWPLLNGGTIEVDSSMCSHDFQMIRRLAARDGGIALLPDTNLPNLDPEAQDLVRVLPKQIGSRLQLHLNVHASMVERQYDFDALTSLVHRFMHAMVPPPALLINDRAPARPNTLGGLRFAARSRAARA